MKTAIKLIGIAVLAIVVLAVILVLSLDSLIRKGVEAAGSHALGVEVKLKRAHLSILRGRLTFSGFEIANPEGFKADKLFEADRIAVAVRPADLLQDELTVEDIVLEGPAVTIEHSTTGINLSKILENIDTGEPKAEEPAEEEEEKTYRIKMLRISGAKVTFSSFLTAKEPVTAPLPDIEMKDISNKDGTGLLLAEVIGQVLVKMSQTAITEGEGIIPADMMKEITGELRGLGSELTGEAVDQTKGIMEKATGAIKGLFGR